MRRSETHERLVIVAVVVSCIVLVLSWSVARAQQSDSVTDQELAEIATAFEPESEDVEPPVDEPRALLRPRREATISSLIAARIDAIHVRDGERFKTGDPLVSFECDASIARLEAMQARLKQYRSIHEANIELRKSNAVSKLDFALSEAKVDEGKAEVSLAAAQLDKCKVLAPYDGRVVKVIANEHESARIGGPLLSILDDRHLEITLHAPSRKVTSLSVGQRFSIAVDETGSDYEATITAIMPVIDPASRTVEVTAEIIGEHPELLAGMSGNATFGESD